MYSVFRLANWNIVAAFGGKNSMKIEKCKLKIIN